MSITKRIKEKGKNLSLQPVPAFPKVMMLEPSNACNHACRFCGNRSSGIKKLNIPLDFAKDILHQAAELGVEEVALYLRGEPFLHPQLAEMVRYAKEVGIGYVYLSSNGAAGSVEAYEAVLNAGLDSFKFSINAGNRLEFEAIHGRDDFEKVVARLRWLIDYRRSTGLDFRIYVSSTFVADTREAIFAMRDEFAPLIDEYYVHGTCPVPGVESIELDHGFTLPCPMVFNRVHVSAEGYMNACCFDFENALAVADLGRMSLREAWASPAFVSVREKHLAKDATGIMCGHCVTGEGAYEPVEKEFILRSKRDANG